VTGLFPFSGVESLASRHGGRRSSSQYGRSDTRRPTRWRTRLRISAVPGKPGELEIVEDEAAIVSRIFAAYAAGRTLRHASSSALGPLHQHGERTCADNGRHTEAKDDRGCLIDLRALVHSVTLHSNGVWEGFEVEVKGKLAAPIGGDVFPRTHHNIHNVVCHTW